MGGIEFAIAASAVTCFTTESNSPHLCGTTELTTAVFQYQSSQWTFAGASGAQTYISKNQACIKIKEKYYNNLKLNDVICTIAVRMMYTYNTLELFCFETVNRFKLFSPKPFDGSPSNKTMDCLCVYSDFAYTNNITTSHTAFRRKKTMSIIFRMYLFS